LLLLKNYSNTNTITLKNAAGGDGSLVLNGDFVMNDTDQYILLVRIGAYWHEVVRSYNDASLTRSHLGLGTAAVEDVGTSIGDVVQLEDVSGSAGLPAVDGSQLTGIDQRGEYILIKDVKLSGTDGGTFTAGSWQVRDVNTISVDETGSVSVSSNQITLPAGTYYCKIRCPAYAVGRHKARLHETTETLSDIYSQNCYASTTYLGYNFAEIVGKFTISSGTMTFEIQHYGQVTKADDGFGLSDGIGDYSETYTVAEFWRVSS